MNFFGSIAVYVLATALLAAGILQVMHGSAWLLVVSLFVYLAAFVKFGCLPSGDSH